MKKLMKHMAVTLLAAFILITPCMPVYAESIFGYSSMELLTKNGEVFDFRAAAGQKLYGYDTL